MKDLLLYVAQNLVEHPEAVTVTEIEGETTVLELRVAPEDMGKVIGRQGRIAKEIRAVVKSVAQRIGKKVNVEIIDVDEE
ncbi:MAG: KH domain-containing protein [Oscillospiraceae bacterium]|nr:KH domain-containing protein [Oscillospiraceae bacterium]